jgi:hypothetical protein
MDSELLEKVESWHERAQNEEDPFVKFIFDYLAFIAIINQRYLNKRSDRKKIQALKQDRTIKSHYLDMITEYDVQKIIKTLNDRPIKNMTMQNTYWNCDEERDCHNRENDGKISSPKDFMNMVEFIYRARNNLFHGRKGYEINRDILIMEYGFILIDPLVEVLITSEGD